MRHPPTRALHRYVDGQLEPTSRVRMAEHLLRCGSCRTEAERLRDLCRALAASPHAPDGLLERAMQSRAAGARVVLPDGARHPAAGIGRPLRLVVLGATAALIALAIPTGTPGEEGCMRTGMRKLLPVTVFGAAMACANEPMALPDSVFQPITRLDAPARLPARMEFRSTRWTDGEVESYQGTTVTTFERIRVDGETEWLGVSRTDGPFIGLNLDTMRFRVESFARVYRARSRPRTRGTWERQTFTADSVVNEVLETNGEWRSNRRPRNPLDADLGLSEFRQAPQGMAIAMALPVEERPYGTLGPSRYQVIGRETITVPAGTFETWRVDFQGFGIRKVWIAVDQPLLVRFEWGSVPNRFESVLTAFEIAQH